MTNTTLLRSAALALGLASTASVWAHGDPTTHFHASHGADTLAGAVFIGALASGALFVLARAVSAWRRRRLAAVRSAA
jgi:hypothetical protein